VPTGVEKAIERALAKVPADRFATARDFAEALEAPAPAPEPNPELHGRALVPLSSRQRKITLAALAVLPLVMMGDSGPPRRPEQIDALDPKRVLVTPFTNNTGDATLTALGDMTADRLASGLNEIQLVQVLDARGMQGVEVGAQAPQRTGGARALAQGLGAGTVLWGSYSRRGDSLEFDARLTDTRAGQVVVPIKSTAGPAGDRQLPSARSANTQWPLAWHFNPQIEEVQASKPTLELRGLSGVHRSRQRPPADCKLSLRPMWLRAPGSGHASIPTSPCL
jgi:TolB-like protein